jgi:hydroxymethylpyrimidine/phosphomethylpyrimidine kinase
MVLILLNPAITQIPVVMSLNCLDPTGGAGIVADLQTAACLGCHCVPITTSIAVFDTCELKDLVAIDSTTLIEQARVILTDMPVHAIKIGMLGSVNNVIAVSTLLQDYAHIPIVFDPMLILLPGQLSPGQELLATLRSEILPFVKVAILQSSEAKLLACNADSIEACAQQLMAQGCEHLLILRSEETSQHINNVYYSSHRQLKTFSWDRLADIYHGAGSTLSGSVAAYLAQGFEPLSAITEGQAYTWQALKLAYRVGMGKLLPNRWYHSHYPRD